jgi:hypothetical protein
MRSPGPRHWLAGLASLATLFLAGLGLPAQASAVASAPDGDGGFGIRLLEAPVERRADPRARRSIVDHLPPGTVIHRKALVVNETKTRLRIEVYPGAASVEKEQFQVGQGRAANELTSWISVDPGHVDVEPGDEAQVTMTINVPPTASTGERYAVVWASVTSNPNPSTNISQVHRVGLRIYLDIGLGGEPPSSFSIGELMPARNNAGEPSLDIKVTNTGARALDMTGAVTLSDGPAGTRAGPFEVVKGTNLAPGDSGTVTVQFPRELPNGPWKIEVNLESGMVKQTATGKITFPDPGQVGEVGSLFSRAGIPWAPAGGSLTVGVIVIAGLLFLIRRSRRRAALSG